MYLYSIFHYVVFSVVVPACIELLCFFFFKQKTAYEMRISDWSSDVCSSDLKTRCIVLMISPRMPRSRSERSASRTTIHSPGPAGVARPILDRKSVVSGKSVSVRVDLGGRRIIKKKKKQHIVTLEQIRLTSIDQQSHTENNADEYHVM